MPAAVRPENRTGLSEFGMGMKTAAVWFAKKFIVKTKPFDEKVVEEVENNKFDSIKRIMWRNSNLDMGTGKKLIESLPS